MRASSEDNGTTNERPTTDRQPNDNRPTTNRQPDDDRQPSNRQQPTKRRVKHKRRSSKQKSSDERRSTKRLSGDERRSAERLSGDERSTDCSPRWLTLSLGALQVFRNLAWSTTLAAASLDGFGAILAPSGAARREGLALVALLAGYAVQVGRLRRPAASHGAVSCPAGVAGPARTAARVPRNPITSRSVAPARVPDGFVPHPPGPLVASPAGSFLARWGR